MSKRSGREKLVSFKAEELFKRPLTKSQIKALQRLERMPESEIDYSDIPPLTDEQLAVAFRPKKRFSRER